MKTKLERVVVLGCFLVLFGSSISWADSFDHGYGQDSWWQNSSAWVPAQVPGADDTANVYYGIILPESPAAVTTVGTLNIDTYISWGPAPDIDIRSGVLNIMDGGQWMWGGFNDYYFRTGTINQYGTFTLVDDIADHYNNGPATVDPVQHSINWGLTFNNYGTMQHGCQGSFSLGAAACQYNNYGTHLFSGDGDITTVGHGGERTTNYGLILKSGGTGESFINGDFDNANGEVRAQSGTVTINNSLDYEGWWTNELEAGKWHVENNANIVIAGRGVLETNSAHIILDGANANLYTTQTYTYTPIDTSLLSNEGILEIYGDRTFTNSIDNSGALLIGDDTEVTASLTNQGELSVGNSPGYAVLNGDYVQTSDGIINVELAGLDAGVEFDLLDILGSADLAGTLNLSYFGGFTAAPGDVFTILNATGVTGSFDTVVFPDAGDWFIDYDRTNGAISVGIVPEPATMSLLVLGAALFRRHKA